MYPDSRLRHYTLFIAGGVMNTAISYSVFLSANLLISYQVAYLIAYATGMVFSYVYNSCVVFNIRLSFGGLTAWPLVYLLQYLAGAILLGLLVEWAGIAEILAPLIVTAATVPITYMASKFVLSASNTGPNKSSCTRGGKGSLEISALRIYHVIVSLYGTLESLLKRMTRILALYTPRFAAPLLILCAANVLVFYRHYVGTMVFPWDFVGGYHYHAVNWYLDSNWIKQSQYIPWGDGGFPSAWMLQNSSFYMPLSVLDILNIPYTLRIAVVTQCLHHFFAMLGVFLLSKRMAADQLSSITAALLFGAGATFYSNAQHVDIVRAVSWLPWVLLVILPSRHLAYAANSAVSYFVSISLKIVVLHQFLISSYPGVVAATAPLFVIISILGHIVVSPLNKTSEARLPSRLLWSNMIITLPLACIIVILLSSPKYLPFIDIWMADGASKPFSQHLQSFSATSELLSTFFGPHDGALAFDFTMRSLWIGPLALVTMTVVGAHNRLQIALSLCALLTILLIFNDVTQLIQTPRSWVSRFPISDYRGALHLLVSLLFALTLTQLRREVLILSFWRFSVVVGLVLLMITSHTLLWRSGGNEIVIYSTAVMLLGFFFSFLIKNNKTRVIVVSVVVLCNAYSTHFILATSWRTPFSFDYLNYYGPNYKGIPSGSRSSLESEYRPKRFFARNKSHRTASDYATAFFNGEYGMYGYNNLKSSGIMKERALMIRNDELLKLTIEGFLAERSQVLFAPADWSVARVVRFRSISECMDEPSCWVGGTGNQLASASWRDYAPSYMSFGAKVRAPQGVIAVINENSFPGWEASIQGWGNNTESTTGLIANQLGLIAVRLPAGEGALRLTYHRQAYDTANILALLGMILWVSILPLHLIFAATTSKRGRNRWSLMSVERKADN